MSITNKFDRKGEGKLRKYVTNWEQERIKKVVAKKTKTKQTNQKTWPIYSVQMGRIWGQNW